MSPELREIVESAYRVFARYRIGTELVVCHCPMCMDEKIERDLVRTPLREIPAKLLAEYTNSAHEFDDVQVAAELRYFLPRYLELIADYDPPCNLGLDICLRRAGYAGYRENWPGDEARVLDEFFDAFLLQSLNRLSYHEAATGPWLDYDLDDALALAVTAGGDLERLLAVLDAASGPEVAIHAAGLATDLMRIRGGPALYAPFLEDYPDQRAQIGKWLVRPEMQIRIEKTFFETFDAGLQGILSRGLEWIKEYS